MTEKQQDHKSRSRSQRRDMSRNPFFNFVKDFKDSNCTNIKSSRDLIKAAGERWRTMSDADKSPYVNAAKEAKNKSPTKNESKSKEAKLEKPKKRLKRKRCCSRCGHREGSPAVAEEQLDGRGKWRRKRPSRFPRREPRDDESADPDTEGTRSRSRSRTESGSRESVASDSSATFY